MGAGQSMRELTASQACALVHNQKGQGRESGAAVGRSFRVRRVMAESEHILIENHRCLEQDVTLGWNDTRDNMSTG